MTKQEFLQELREHLSGEVSAESLMDSYRYYDNYIDESIRSGKTEEQAVDELGKPYLIARSIIDASTGARAVDVEYTEDGKTKKVNRKAEEQRQQKQQDDSTHERGVKKEFHFDPFSWYAKLLYVLVAIVLIVVLVAVVFGVVAIAINLAIPILIILGIVYLVMYFTRNDGV